MADFSSDTDDSAVDELISQTRDLCVLEQLAAINCSGFSDSPLPADLDSRFRRLKSFPVTATRPPHSSSSAAPDRRRPDDSAPGIANQTPTDRNEAANPENEKLEGEGKGGSEQSHSRSASSPLESPNMEDFEEGKNLSKVKGKIGKIKDIDRERKLGILTLSSSSSQSMDDDIFSPSGLNIEEKKSRSKSASKLKFGAASSPLGSSKSKSWTTSSPSPPRRTGCFWCSPKRDSPRKSKENRVKGTSFDWSQQDDILSDLGIFSKKEQQKLMKKAMKEEERISREAEKIVRMARQASARITVTGIEDELSDDESPKYI